MLLDTLLFLSFDRDDLLRKGTPFSSLALLAGAPTSEYAVLLWDSAGSECGTPTSEWDIPIMELDVSAIEYSVPEMAGLVPVNEWTD